MANQTLKFPWLDWVGTFVVYALGNLFGVVVVYSIFGSQLPDNTILTSIAVLIFFQFSLHVRYKENFMNNIRKIYYYIPVLSLLTSISFLNNPYGIVMAFFLAMSFPAYKNVWLLKNKGWPTNSESQIITIWWHVLPFLVVEPLISIGFILGFV